MIKQVLGVTTVALLTIAMFITGCKKNITEVSSPLVTVIGSNPYFIQKNAVWTDPGATAYDATDGILPATTSDPVNTAVPGLYNVTYSTINSVGNHGNYTRAVYVMDIDGYYSNVLDVSPYPGGASSTYSNYTDTMHLSKNGSGEVTLNKFGNYVNGNVYFNLDSAISLTLPSQNVTCGSPSATIKFVGKGSISRVAPTVIINYKKYINGDSVIAQATYTR